MKEGSAGADRWYDYHKNTMHRLEQLILILENPDTEVGAQIKLRNDNAFSPLRRAVESKLANGSGSEQRALHDIRKLLGGGLG